MDFLDIKAAKMFHKRKSSSHQCQCRVRADDLQREVLLENADMFTCYYLHANLEDL